MRGSSTFLVKTGDPSLGEQSYIIYNSSFKFNNDTIRCPGSQSNLARRPHSPPNPSFNLPHDLSPFPGAYLTGMARGRSCLLLFSALISVSDFQHSHAKKSATAVIPLFILPSARDISPQTLIAATRLQRRGPIDAPPEHGMQRRPFDGLLYAFFRAKLVQQLGGSDTASKDFAGLIELIRKLNTHFPASGKVGTQKAAQNILRSLFPSWLPAAFAVMFSKPFPAFSARMNAIITGLTTYWLMGESEIIDVDVDGGSVGVGQGLLVKRCRYLEEAGCASICVNTCKIPTQNFFCQDMGLPLTMTPDYDDFSCTFAFGLTPPPVFDDEAMRVACFSQCPTAKAPTGELSNCHQIEL